MRMFAQDPAFYRNVRVDGTDANVDSYTISSICQHALAPSTRGVFAYPHNRGATLANPANPHIPTRCRRRCADHAIRRTTSAERGPVAEPG